MALVDLLKSIDFNKKSYMLLSNGGDDSIKAEKLVKSLEECKITHMPFFEYGDSLGRNIGALMFTYPTLHVATLRQTQQFVGYEAIEKYINKIDVKKYLMTWLALVNRMTPYLIFKVYESFETFLL